MRAVLASDAVTMASEGAREEEVIVPPLTGSKSPRVLSRSRSMPWTLTPVSVCPSSKLLIDVPERNMIGDMPSVMFATSPSADRAS
jgi:hypothetical protein